MKKYYEPEKVLAEVCKEPVPEEVRILYLRPGELLSIQEKFPVAYQPLGTLEWHGRQNPLGCDSIKAEQLCIAAARKTGGVVMPAIHFATDGYRERGSGLGLGMDANAGFLLPGTFYKLENHLLRDMLVSACENYLSRGFRMVVLVSGHNPRMQQYLMDEVCYRLKTAEGEEPVIFTMEYMVLPEGHPMRYTDHAGCYETAMMLHLAGERVNLQANTGKKEPLLGIMTDAPIESATGQKGAAHFTHQVQGLVSLVTKKYRDLTGGVM